MGFSKGNIILKLKGILKKMNSFSAVEQLKDEENLFSIGALDSLVLIQFVLMIEEEFKIRIDNADISYDHFSNFAKIYEMLSLKHKI